MTAITRPAVLRESDAARQRDFITRDLLVTLGALALVLMWDFGGADLAVARWFGDGHGFAWRHHWATSSVAHDGGRVLGWLLLGALVVNIWRPLIDGPDREERVRWALMTLACLLLIPTIKRFSPTSCPWDLAEFGGVAQYLSHWRLGVADGGPGHCFPSGHAVAAFAFFSGWFALRRSRPRLARAWLAGVLVAGAVFGIAQLMRGAHFPSHTLWSAWGCWVVCAAVAPRGPQALRSSAA